MVFQIPIKREIEVVIKHVDGSVYRERFGVYADSSEEAIEAVLNRCPYFRDKNILIWTEDEQSLEDVEADRMQYLGKLKGILLVRNEPSIENP